MSLPRRTVTVVNAIDTRLLNIADLSLQFQLALNQGSYYCPGTTVTQVAAATMVNPSGGVLQIIADLTVPDGTADVDVGLYVKTGVESVLSASPFLDGYNLPGNTTVFHSSADPTPEHPPANGLPANGQP